MSAPTGARTAAQAAARAARAADLPALDRAVSHCVACPRLVLWRQEVAATRRAAYADQIYWGRPVPGFGPADASIGILGLAPAAHGGNRTGRVFTGDSSGDWLFASLHRVGIATQETSVHAGDGQALVGARMVATVRCAPPQNQPTTLERDTCEPWLAREVGLLLPQLRVVVALGAYGWAGALRGLAAAGGDETAPKPPVGHAGEGERGGRGGVGG